MNIEIFDDFLTEYQCQSIDNTLSHSSFPWYFNKDLNGVEFVGNFYFFHLFLERRMNNKESQYLPVVLPIIDKLGVPLSKVRRIKGNLSTRTQRRYHHQSQRQFRAFHYERFQSRPINLVEIRFHRTPRHQRSDMLGG